MQRGEARTNADACLRQRAGRGGENGRFQIVLLNEIFQLEQIRKGRRISLRSSAKLDTLVERKCALNNPRVIAGSVSG